MTLAFNKRIHELYHGRMEPPQPKSAAPVVRTAEVLPRDVSVEEMIDMAQQVWAANPHLRIADSERNGNLISAAFLQTGPARDLACMVQAVKAMLPQLDIVPLPEPPKFEEELYFLSNGEWPLPMPSDDVTLRKASREQVRNYLTRVRKYEEWVAEQNQQ